MNPARKCIVGVGAVLNLVRKCIVGVGAVLNPARRCIWQRIGLK